MHVYVQSGKGTCRKHHDNIVFALDYDGQIEFDFKPLESLVHKDILNHIGGNEPRGRSAEVGRTARRSLHTHTTDDQQRLSCIPFLEYKRVDD